ncbi:c-type cytochrome [Helicobacter kayseriensis]|uniref:c-type cytochrome n=1 Tax=Helicobacter kayseriensis TaxID=2905877 RepID=UPI001E562FDE|nr:c-type cytochrome [Helicobacter kayseriensis]MCE3046552.1 c-type cytochrome [Helicobacter kayseriensis]MCE3048146.1 c-type cytochrome [Helicobacter kayseriensis]
MKKIIAICVLGLSSMMFAQAPALFNKCVACHGKDGKKVGIAPQPLAGLSKDEVVKFLQGYKNQTIKSPKANMMYSQAKNLSDADINTLAEYIATLK